MKKHLFIGSALALSAAAALAQGPAITPVSDGRNSGNQIYGWSNSEVVTNDALSGIGYVANFGGAWFHYGPEAATLVVNGYYNAWDPIASQIEGGATPANPGIDWFTGLDNSGGIDPALGGSTQELSGTTAPRFGIVNFANGEFFDFHITNLQGAEVGKMANFTNSITTTVRDNTYVGALRFLDGANYSRNTPVGADFQYVNGYVGKIGDDAFTFPVGSQFATNTGLNDSRTLSISAPADVTDHLSIAHWAGDPNDGLDPTNGTTTVIGGEPHPRTSLNTTPLILPEPGGGPGFTTEVLKSVTPLEQWDWIAVSGTSNVAITVNFTQNEAVTGGYQDATKIRLVGWNIANQQWELLGNTQATRTAEGGEVSGRTDAYPGRNMSSYSAIAYGSISEFALPVTLTDFTAVKQGNRGLLSWKTSSEQNSSHFEVERSADGRAYTSIGRVAAAGNSSTERTYSLPDALPLTGANYYRLKMVDVDGTVKYSVIRLLNFGGKAVIVMYPNPAVNSTTLTGVEAGMRVILSDGQGRRIREERVSGTTHPVSVAGLARGMYQVQVLDAKGAVVSVLKLNKQ